METRQCLICSKTKPIVSFKLRDKGVRAKTCRSCSGFGKGDGDFIYLRKWSFDRYKPKPEQIIEALNVLKGMGYNIEKDIHRQFCDKWGFEYQDQHEVLYSKEEILRSME